jgi:hypothetical protein
MAKALVTADIHLPLDVLGNLATQVTLHFDLLIYKGAEPGYLVVT